MISLFLFFLSSFLMALKTQISSSSLLNSTHEGGRLENYTGIFDGPISPSQRKQGFYEGRLFSQDPEPLSWFCPLNSCMPFGKFLALSEPRFGIQAF